MNGLYTVTLTIPSLPGDTHADAARTFVLVMRDWLAGALDTQRRVALGLILGEVVKTHGLQAKPEQVRAMVEEQAQTYEQPEQWVKWFYQAPERLRDVESRVLEDNVVAWALAIAKVEDRPIVFDELMGNK